ncbi:hypothetical protein [Altericista sp. CCNU0014]|uniref:hypothetical protein n=1 Tax=Altericista sp. CCNU0014 TaxID=3082949 RepID=UPI00384ACEE5
MKCINSFLRIAPLTWLAIASSALAVPQFSGAAHQSQPPTGCPPGWEQATYPLNPQLGCLPTHIQAKPGQSESQTMMKPLKVQGFQEQPPTGCRPGWSQAKHPLNFQLGCLPGQIQSAPQPR